MKTEVRGIIPPLVTPFAKDGSINATMFRKIINHVINAGVHGVFIAGSQGEFFSLERQERISLFEIAVDEVNGRVPVYAGTAAVSTSETVLLTQAAESVGCDAVSVISPFFITPNGQELYQHYKAIAKATHLPVLLYNNPDRTGYDIPVDTIKRLAEIDNIVGMKDSGGNLTYVNEVMRSIGTDFSILSGKDTVIFNILTAGGRGAVPASANVAPKLIVDLYNYVQSGDYDAARKAQFELAPLRMAFSLGSFPIVVKEALDIMGFDVGGARAPIQPLTPENRSRLTEVLKKMNLC
ncbi:dihydrodipicolinate synthase family protein [Anaerosporomusa subterranea]|uniref:4-hydroxy-tetrahydrodipicolinate synthase n=1 Tax=Anaerosporomusa subterranea TaxID=1794912 RepID=A0A154BP56_ANASB|nr:4-hydroxy-tetrahydrodipicolinate synthase [Anaerosporomusa subterranea]KYZ75777.1 dihydrodipicolinate synthase family protein [Anaerosporomusa subterranea]